MLTLVVVVFFALRFTALRDVDRFEDIETTPATGATAATTATPP